MTSLFGLGHGMLCQRLLRKGNADLQMQIAMAPGVDSLNVATAAAIALDRLRSAAAR